MELPRLAWAPLAGILLVASLAWTGTARAATTITDPNTPVLVTQLHTPPAGHRLTAAKVERIAAASPVIKAERRRHPAAYPAEYTKGPGQWQVSWWLQRHGHQKEIAQVYVDDATGKVTEAWTGYQVQWTMARGYPGAFGRRVNALYVWLPLCFLFLAPFIPWRRPRRLSLLHLDLLVLLSFSISLAFFNHANIGMSVPLVYPFLLYLLVRMLLLAVGRGRPRGPLPLTVPVAWLSVAVVFLAGFRIGLNVVNSNVIDVGYAGVIGADKLIHGHALYGHWPIDNASGDTYGPVNYYAYVPFRAIFGWSGYWDDLPAAHAAAIAFDLLTLLGLFLLGRRVRGPTLGVAMAYAWAAYPFTLFSLESNSNDTLVALLVVLSLLAATSSRARGLTGWFAGRFGEGLGAIGRGISAALAGFAKLGPLVLAPLMLRGTGPRPRPRSLFLYAAAYAATAAVVMLPVFLDANLHAFWHDTISYQANRPAPFSIWGLWGGLSFEQHLVQGAVVALGLAAAVLPRGRRGPVELAALAAALLIALQLAVTYWFYMYVVWFFPLVIAALFMAHPGSVFGGAHARPRGSAHAPIRPPVHAPAATTI